MFKILLFISLIFSISAQNRTQLQRQAYFNFKVPQKDFLYYHFEVLEIKKNKIDLKFHLEIAYDVLQFIKADSVFVSKIDISCIFEQSNNYQTRRIIDSIFVREYKQTLNHQLMHGITFILTDIDPEDIFFKINILDILSSKTKRYQNKTTLKDVYSSNFIVSIFANDKFQVNQLQIPYNQTIIFKIKMRNEYYRLNLTIVERDLRNILFSRQYLISDKNQDIVVALDPIIDLLNEGYYELVITEHEQTVYSQNFQIIWWDKPESLFEYELAFRPFILLLDEKEKNYFLNLKNKDKTLYFERFWKTHQSTQANGYNPLKHEFFQRADYVIQKLSNDARIGWDRDIGISYLLHGKALLEEKVFKKGYEFLVWTYEHFSKIFYFDERVNDYIFLETSYIDLTE